MRRKAVWGVFALTVAVSCMLTACGGEKAAALLPPEDGEVVGYITYFDAENGTFDFDQVEVHQYITMNQEGQETGEVLNEYVNNALESEPYPLAAGEVSYYILGRGSYAEQSTTDPELFAQYLNEMVEEHSHSPLFQIVVQDGGVVSITEQAVS